MAVIQVNIGTIGLKNAGKTVFHSVLYGCRNGFPGTVFSFPDKSTVQYLRPIWEELDNGRLPVANIAGQPDFLKWNVRVNQPSGGKLEWSVRTVDYAGALVNRTREDDLELLAKKSGLDAFFDKCDALVFLIDVTSDKQVHSQLDTLAYLLERNERIRTGHGSRVRPVAVAFTKCDSILSSLGLQFLEAQAELLAWLAAHPRWAQMINFLETPLSCYTIGWATRDATPRGIDR
jgi:hypothetical protein